jgi:hypothetical protein
MQDPYKTRLDWEGRKAGSNGGADLDLELGVGNVAGAVGAQLVQGA